ncbi:MAG: MarR family transcriptional regulator [Paracoccaceae bacterium]
MKLIPEKHLQHWINRLGFVLRRDLQIRFRQHGIRLGAEEWSVLLLLWQKDNRTTGDLADLTVKDQTTMTRLLDGLVRKNLLTRVPDPDDRRRARISLSPQGTDMQSQLVPIALGLIQQSQKGISTDDLHTTRRVLQQMTQNMLEPEVEE